MLGETNCQERTSNELQQRFQLRKRRSHSRRYYSFLIRAVVTTLLFLSNGRRLVPIVPARVVVVAWVDTSALVRASRGATTRRTVVKNTFQLSRSGTTTSFHNTKPIPFVVTTLVRGGGDFGSSSRTTNMAKESSSLHSHTIITTNTKAASVPSPPTIHRDEERFVLVGNVTDSDDGKMRQSEDSANALLDPPVSVPDPYGFLRDDNRTFELVLAHLRAENDYTEQIVAPCQELKETIYHDFLSYIQETDYTTPSIKNNYIYYQRTFQGKSYSVHCRAPVPNKNDSSSCSRDLYVIAQGWDKSANTTILPGEQVLLDENDLAEGKSHCHVGTVQVSPSGNLLAYTVDETGGEKYSLIVQNIETKKDCLAVPLNDIDSTVVWGPDDTSLYYLRFDDTHRPFQVYKHILTTGPSDTPQPNDQLLFQEDDELFWVSIDKSQDEKFLFIDASSKETSEVHFIELSNKHKTTEPSYYDAVSCVSKRRNKVLYSVEHYKGNFLIATNVGGTKNMRLMVAPVVEHSQDLWEDVIHSTHSQVLFTGGADKCLEAIHPFESHVVLSGRENGMPSIWVAQFDDFSNKSTRVQSYSKLEFEEEVHDVCLGPNHEYVTDSILINYDSLITPTQSILLPLKDPNNERRIVKEKYVPGYDKSLYTCERFSVPSRDGTALIPVSMVYRKGTIPTNGTSWREQSIEKPVNVHMYGYGSYGMVGPVFFQVFFFLKLKSRNCLCHCSCSWWRRDGTSMV